MWWKDMGIIKKGFTIGWIVGLILFVLSGIFMLIYTATHIGDYSCPAIVDTTNCHWDEVGSYVSQVLIIFGLPIFLASIISGLFISWSLSKQSILKGEIIGAISAIFLLLIFSIPNNLSRYLFGDGPSASEYFIYIPVGILVGSLVGWVISFKNIK